MFELMPFENDNNLLRSFDNFEKHFFRELNRSAMGFRCDIQDKGDHYLLEAELPGFEKKDIKVGVENGMITIRAEHTEEKEHKDAKNFVRKERRYGRFERSFDASGIRTDDISCQYQDGILSVTLPKREREEPPVKWITIQ